MALMVKLRPHSEEHFGPESSMNPVIVRKLLACYTQKYALGLLDKLETYGERDINRTSMLLNVAHGIPRLYLPQLIANLKTPKYIDLLMR